MQSISIFCGANSGSDPEYAALAVQAARAMVDRGIRIVYGAGKVGLMGEVADAALERGGQVTGVIPYFLKELEVCHDQLSELYVVDTMHQRKQRMVELSDGFLILPGGFGTLDEFFEILTWKQLRLHQKPIGLLNAGGYYDHLIGHMDHMVREGFLRKENRSLVLVSSDLMDLLDAMVNYRPGDVADKWLDRS